MPHIPEHLRREFIPAGKLPKPKRGKVRDSYELNGELLLPVATDRLSGFDFVAMEIPGKGEVLTATDLLWRTDKRMNECCKQDLVGFGSTMNAYLHPDLSDDPVVLKRAKVIAKKKVAKVEAIVRGYLTGSGWEAYVKTAPNHVVCGHRLPPGLRDGDRLPEPIFTPTTKAEVGHDEHMDVDEVRKRFPKMEPLALRLFKTAGEIALERGIIIADTKLEFGESEEQSEERGEDGDLVLVDEEFTADSSRFWALKDWELSRREGRSPVPFDKQFARNELKKFGVHLLKPEKEDHLKYVDGLKFSPEAVHRTARLYRYIFYLLSGKRLEEFQHSVMGIKGDVVLPPIEILLGSESDLRQVEAGIELLRKSGVRFRLHVISCHRNPMVLMEYVRDLPSSVGLVIAAAGMLATLPGIFHSWLRYFGKDYIPVVGVGLEGGGPSAEEAARLSMSELPGKPVMMRVDGTPYFGQKGFFDACSDAISNEFFAFPSATKEAKLDLVVS